MFVKTNISGNKFSDENPWIIQEIVLFIFREFLIYYVFLFPEKYQEL